ncbi:LysM peptidoglycan-binding domain-containing protein [Roseobacter sp. EG26]|uniref:LysM peptidoglycan-binding domain-containing protein n=1 Tax=Roseobacter sp. EG26 TaxID=3412477 RepID=UPI002630348B|nr:LysM peptidoglycan-binding domain-containing protein [uncultured Roseobacter sp.]
MTHFISRSRLRLSLMSASALVVLAACDQPLDFDLRGGVGGFSTADAATQVIPGSRPSPDDRGVISYPNYQVAIADRGDTISSVATRLGVSTAELARFNGIEADVPLRKGEVIALPKRVAEPSPATGAIGTGPIQPGGVDIGTLAGDAINRAPESTGVQTAALPPAATSTPTPQTGQEPIRHKVERGETAYTIARLYQVPVKTLAEWNGLGADFAIREGQFLLIPVAKQAPPAAAASAVTQPGAGSPTPTPPSATKPLPEPEKTVAVPTEPAADLGPQTTASSSARMVFPVSGSIIREYAKGKNEGINIKSDPGSAVKSADAGTVAAITKSADGIPIIVVRHDPELLTVYANVTDVSVKKGTKVKRGEPIAKLRPGKDAYVHFEVRKGFDSVDPLPYLQ